MNKLNLIFALVFSLTFSSCHIALEALEALENASQQAPSTGSDSSGNTSSDNSNSSPAPSTPLPPPSTGSTTTTRSDANTDMAAFYRAIKLSDTQITEFEAITQKYKSLVSKAKLKYKAQPTEQNKEIKRLRHAQEAEYKAMMSNYQYGLFQEEMKKQSGTTTKGKIGG